MSSAVYRLGYGYLEAIPVAAADVVALAHYQSNRDPKHVREEGNEKSR